MRRFASRFLVAVVVLTGIAIIFTVAYLRRSLPVIDGDIAVPGISAPVEIVRDVDGIPHITAATRLDALYGLGYVHAQDRLWQMEFQRRIAQGRLSEVFGKATIREDRFLRTVGFARAAQSAWELLPPDGQVALNAYVAGVNAFITSHRGSRLPPEFTLLRFEPAPWSGADVLGWAKMMAWDLSANYEFELLRHDLEARVGFERMRELLPLYAADGPTIVQPADASSSLPAQPAANPVPAPSTSASVHAPPTRTAPPRGLTTTLAPGVAQRWLDASRASLDTPIGRVLLAGQEGIGSNNWVVDGSLTASGKPLLANDPHLAPKIPSLWYLAHMKAGDFEVIGATLPGTPVVVIGRNRSIAWGVTNVAADVQDLYRERLDAAGRQAEFRGAMEPIRIVEETIGVKDGQSVVVNVRVTRHGPLVSDAINANNAEDPSGEPHPRLEPLAFRWTALDEDDNSVLAFLGINDARNWNDFTAALRQFVAPSQNFVYADVDGHIGYYAPGRIPIRSGGDGSTPAEGWTGNAEWAGWIPFDELPHVYDPAGHLIVTANHKPMPAGYPHQIALEYPEPYRALRITELLEKNEKKRKLTPDDFRDIQADTYSRQAQALLPLLLDRVSLAKSDRPDSPERPDASLERVAIDLLRTWTFDAAGNSPAAAVYEAWFLQLAPHLVGDELGDVLDDYRGRFSFVTRFVARTIPDDSNRWCDDVRTPQSETCTEAVTAALHDAVRTLSTQLGKDPARWRWSGLLHASFPHQGLDSVTGLHWLLSRSSPGGGDFSTVNVAPVAPDKPFEQREVPSYRQIVDLSPLNDNRFLDTTGQSGHFLSPHYDDALPAWRAVRHRPMRMDRNAIERDAAGHLRLLPERN